MSDAWEDIQKVQRKRNTFRERLEKRKKEREDILGSSLVTSRSLKSDTFNSSKEDAKQKGEKTDEAEDLVKIDPELEQRLLKELAEVTLSLPISSTDLTLRVKTNSSTEAQHKQVCNLLQKFSMQKLIIVKDSMKDGVVALDVISVEVTKVNAMIAEFFEEPKAASSKDTFKRKRKEIAVNSVEPEEDKRKKEKKEPNTDILVNTNMII